VQFKHEANNFSLLDNFTDGDAEIILETNTSKPDSPKVKEPPIDPSKSRHILYRKPKLSTVASIATLKARPSDVANVYVEVRGVAVLSHAVAK
jgi:hypothetical protein